MTAPTEADLRLARETSSLGVPNGEQLRCHLPMNVRFEMADGMRDAVAYPADFAPALFLRHHPDGAHMFAALALGRNGLALFHALTVEELERLSEAAFRASVKMRQINTAADAADKREG